MSRPPEARAAGLTPRFVGTCILLAFLNATAFAVLLVAIGDERDQSQLARQARARIAAADRMEQALDVIDSTTAAYVLSGSDDIAARRAAALDDFAVEALALASMADDAQASALTVAGQEYIAQSSEPLFASRGTPDDPIEVAALANETQRRMDELSSSFASYREDTTAQQLLRQGRSDDATRRGIAAAAIGLVGSVVLMAAFATYLVRAVLRPLRRAAEMADTLARGDLTVRMPRSGAGEIGELQHSFNTMAESLESTRDELLSAAEEQAALHRVAALVASGVRPQRVFDSVVREVGVLLDASSTILVRYEADTSAIIAAAQTPPPGLEVGASLPLETPPLGAVVTTGGGRVDDEQTRASSFAGRVRDVGLASAVSAPIVVDGRPWGAVVLGWEQEHDELDSVAERTHDFTDLISSAIANADSVTKLEESRARLVTAADEARRRIERDLHDGTQQRLVSLGLEYRLAIARVPPEQADLSAELSELTDELGLVVSELQELSRGIHPAILSQGGLVPALRGLGRRAPLPVELAVDDDRRLHEAVEAAAYYIASEALTNIVKYAEASVVELAVSFDDTELRLRIRDDGRGGADPARGSGLIGLSDRAEAVGGRVLLDSPIGVGTTIDVWLPLRPEPGG